MKRLILALCFIGIAAFGWIVLRPHSSKKPNIILVVIETLRADHLSLYGYPRDTSPTLDAFAKENTWFRNAFASAPWTPPSVATIMTGLYPTTHGMRPGKSRQISKKHQMILGGKLSTIAEQLLEAGYHTSVFSTNPWITKDFGFKQGFQKLYYREWLGADVVIRGGKKIIETDFADRSKPFFLYLHFFDPHDPYTPPPPYDKKYSGRPPLAQTERGHEEINLYDGDIRFMDDQFKDFFEFLKAKDLYDDTKILIIADHGEQFFERGEIGHGKKLYNEEIKVPLIIKDNNPRGEITNLASNVDVVPTLLTWAKLPLPPYLQGVPLTDDSRLEARQGVFSETDRAYYQRAFISQQSKKLIVEYNDKDLTSVLSRSLLDFKSDPHELNPLSDPAETELMQGYLTEKMQEVAQHSTQEEAGDDNKISDKVINQLESLGYLN